MRQHTQLTSPGLDEDHGRIGANRFEQRGGQLARQEIRQDGGVHHAADERIIGVGGRADVLARHCRQRRGHRVPSVLQIARGPQRLEHFGGFTNVSLGHGTRAGACGQPAQRELADRGLITFADEIEDRRTLRDVVVRLGRARLTRAELTAQAQELTPGAGRTARINRRLHLRQANLGFFESRRGDQRLDGDELSLDRFGRRRVRRADDVVGNGERRVGVPAANREPRADHAHGPLVPLARLMAVRAIGFTSALQVLGRPLVIAAHQRHLRERVVHGAGRLMEADRAAGLERAVQQRVGTRQVPHPHTDLAERAEGGGRDREGTEILDAGQRPARRAPGPRRVDAG